MKTTGILVSLIAGLSLVSLSYGQETEGFADQLKLKDYRPVSVFKLEEIPTMARGRGVTLQKYKDGNMSDIQIFKEEEGFTYNRAGGTKTETDLLSWLGHRAQIGKLAPFGFPKSNKFLKD